MLLPYGSYKLSMFLLAVVWEPGGRLPATN